MIHSFSKIVTTLLEIMLFVIYALVEEGAVDYASVEDYAL